MVRRVYQDQLRKKRRRKFLLKLLAVTGVVFLFLGGIIYLSFFAGLFDVRTIDINGAEVISSADLRAVAESWLKGGFLGLARNRNLLFFSANDLAGELTAKFPRIDSIEVKKEFPHRLKIAITERQSAGIWCFVADNRCFYFDKSGVAYAEAARSSGFLILNVADYRGQAVALGSRVGSQEWIKNIITAREVLMKVGISAAEFSIPPDSFDEFDAKTAEGWKIFFSNSADVTQQISSLAILLRDKLPAEKRKSLEYFDLRIQDRIYYR
jgi:cell division septal protein FtsQ